MIILRWRFIAIIVERDVFEACYNNMYNDISVQFARYKAHVSK